MIMVLSLPGMALAQTTSGQGWNLSSISTTNLPNGTIYGIITNILDWLLGILAVFGIIGFIISGILYLVSTGDENTIERAKKAMTWSIVGVIVGLMGYVVIQAVDTALMGTGGGAPF